VIKDKESAQRVEDIWLVHQTLSKGNYGVALRNDTPERKNTGVFPEFGKYRGF
jgi:hypothetical protein